MIETTDFGPELHEAFERLCSAVEPFAGFAPEDFGQAITLFTQPYLDGVISPERMELMPEIMEALRDVGLALHYELAGNPQN